MTTAATALTEPLPADYDDPRGVLVVIGGLPGSGKTTLLRRILGTGLRGVSALDSELVAEQLSGTGIRVPYQLLRPLVHAVHRLRVLRTVAGDARVVVLTDPWTSPGWRAAVLGAARQAGRQVRVVLIDVSSAAAVQGQASRGRAVPRRRMHRHEARWSELMSDLAYRRPGDDVVAISRAAARRVSAHHVLGRCGIRP
jgi:predicted ATPase